MIKIIKLFAKFGQKTAAPVFCPGQRLFKIDFLSIRWSED